MRFDKFLEEKKRLLILLQGEDQPQINIEDPLILAYLGDAWFSFFVRQKMIACGNYKVRILQDIEGQVVSAPMQAFAWREMEDFWAEEERTWFRRGRNASPSRARSGSDYRTSTGFEAVLGYLLQSNQEERLREVAEKSLQVMIQKMELNGGS